MTGTSSFRASHASSTVLCMRNKPPNSAVIITDIGGDQTASELQLPSCSKAATSDITSLPSDRSVEKTLLVGRFSNRAENRDHIILLGGAGNSLFRVSLRRQESCLWP